MKTEQGGGKKYVPAAGRLCWGEEGDIVSLWGRGGHKQRPQQLASGLRHVQVAGPRLQGSIRRGSVQFQKVPEGSSWVRAVPDSSVLHQFLAIPEGSGGFCVPQCQGNLAFMAV